MMQKEKNDLEPVGLHIIDACVLETKDPVGTSFLTGIEVWLNVKCLVQIVPCMEVAIKMNHLWGRIFDDILPFFEGNCPKKRNISEAIAFEARSLIDSQSSLPDNCEKTRSFFPNDSKKDMPESSSGSCANPILENFVEEVLQEKNHALMSQISGPCKHWWWTTIDIVKYKGF
ncbi:hypothetical protein CMV_013063 [Castanea mollissima]|uniref:Uncharacterized protein n=1 Tax=Castanea mollissima TaxID=60419 RepID=A0A8J4VM95_9ROSI|nr:hypothetical protein CMV_013063 [Castanea mollissima]